MNLDELKQFLLWSTIIHYSILLLWFGAFVFAHDALHRLHARWFALSTEQFDALNYAGVSIYKIGIVLFSVVPLIAVHLIS